MTAYFDRINRIINDPTFGVFGEEKFLSDIALIEKRVIEQVVLVTGDREFPDDLREKILGAIAIKGICQIGGLPVLEKTKAMVLALKKSILLDDLHSAFHELAARNIRTRFGVFSDSPNDILQQREAWEQETFPEQEKFQECFDPYV